LEDVPAGDFLSKYCRKFPLKNGSPVLSMHQLYSSCLGIEEDCSVHPEGCTRVYGVKKVRIKIPAHTRIWKWLNVDSISFASQPAARLWKIGS